MYSPRSPTTPTRRIAGNVRFSSSKCLCSTGTWKVYPETFPRGRTSSDTRFACVGSAIVTKRMGIAWVRSRNPYTTSLVGEMMSAGCSATMRREAEAMASRDRMSTARTDTSAPVSRARRRARRATSTGPAGRGLTMITRLAALTGASRAQPAARTAARASARPRARRLRTETPRDVRRSHRRGASVSRGPRRCTRDSPPLRVGRDRHVLLCCRHAYPPSPAGPRRSRSPCRRDIRIRAAARVDARGLAGRARAAPGRAAEPRRPRLPLRGRLRGRARRGRQCGHLLLAQRPADRLDALERAPRRGVRGAAGHGRLRRADARRPRRRRHGGRSEPHRHGTFGTGRGNVALSTCSRRRAHADL